MEFSKQVSDFLSEFVYKQMGITTVTSENLFTVRKFFAEQYFLPIIMKEDKGEMKGNRDKAVIKLMCKVLSELIEKGF